MKRLLALLRHGKGLRHAPVVHEAPVAFAPRVMLQGLPGGPLDVSRDHCPVSLRPFVLGLRLPSPPDPRRALSLEFRMADGEASLLARLALKPFGRISLKQDGLHLFAPDCTANRCLPRPALWFRYLLAWQDARRAAGRGDALRMSAPDLRALNAYYIVPRPVFLVGVAHEECVNLFPMDLVAPLPSDAYVLALRATSPAVQMIEASGRIAMSSAPAGRLEEVYALGRQHGRSTLDLQTLTLPITRSPLFGLPVLDQAGLTRELSVEAVHRIGSHALFVTRIEREAGQAGRQLAHVSGMYVEWLRRRARPCETLGAL
ncbi:MAG TPA: flavin reductase [Burkholderiaceae bacterium]